MTERPKLGFGDYITLLLILAVAVGARFFYVQKYANKAQSNGPYVVQGSVTTSNNAESAEQLKNLVDNLRTNKGFVSEAPFSKGPETTAHTSPGYPYVLSLLARINPDKWQQWARYLQCVLGGLTAVLYFLFAFRAFRMRLLATIVGVFCALHPFWIANTAALNDGTLTAFALAWVLHLGARASEEDRHFSSLLYGLVLAGLALLRSTMLPFAFVAMIWFLWRCRRPGKGWLSALLAFLGFINGLLPWTLRNFKEPFKSPVPVVSSAYYHLSMGNNYDANGGPLSEEEHAKALARYTPDKSADQWIQDLEGSPKQVERYRKLGPPTLTHVKKRPDLFMQQRLEAAQSFLFSHAWFEDPPDPADRKRAGRTLVGVSAADPMPDWLASRYQTVFGGVLLGMLFFGMLGWRWSFGWRDSSSPMALALIWAPVPYILSHAGELHGPRMPLDGILLTYTAFAIFALLPGTRQSLLAGENPPPEEEQDPHAPPAR